MKPLRIHKPDTAIKLTYSQAYDIGIIDPKADQQRLEIETKGVWNIISKCKGICLAANYSGFPVTKEKVEIYGTRTLSNPKQSGYELEGAVSIGGKNYTAFTSSQLFEIEGHLIDVGIIHARKELK